MLWSKRIDFTLADTQELIGRAWKSVEESVSDKLYLTRDGVITEKQLALEVAQALQSRTDIVAPEVLAVELGVISKEAVASAVKNVVPTLSNVFQDHAVVYPGPVATRLGSELSKAVETEPQSATRLCSQLGVTLRVLEWLVQQQRLVLLDKDMVIAAEDFDRRKASLLAQITTTEEPLDISTIEPNVVVRRELVKGLTSSTPKGSIDAATRIWTPQVYTDRLREQSLSILRSIGYIRESDLRGIRDPAKFARTSDATLSRGYVLLNSWVDEQITMVKASLNDKGWFDLGDLVLPWVIDGQIGVTTKLGGHFLVRPSFETSQKDAVLTSVEAQARSDAAGLESMDQLRSLQPPSIQLSGVNDADLERALASKFGTTVRSKYVDTTRRVLSEKIAAAEAAAQRQLDTKIAVYLQGVQACPEPLKAQVYAEWQQYLSEQGRSAPPYLGGDSLESAVPQPWEEVTEEEVASAKSKLVDIVETRLRKAHEPALVLHLAVILRHAKTHKGVLKIGGRTVPKVLKALPQNFPESFHALKANIRSPPSGLLDQVRSEAIEQP